MKKRNFPDVVLQKGLVRHNPPHTYGDCHRAAVAMVLSRPVESVPHFFDNGSDPSWDPYTDWLEENDIHRINTVFNGDCLLESIYLTMDICNGNRPFILGGKSSLGENHSVVIQKMIMFDPSPVDSGIVGPTSNDLFEVEYLIPGKDYSYEA